MPIDSLTAFALGSAVGGFAVLGPLLLAERSHGSHRVGLMLVFGVTPLCAMMYSGSTVYLPYLLAVGVVAAIASVPLAVIHYLWPIRRVIAAGALGSALSLVLLVHIQASMGVWFLPPVAALAVLTAVAAGYTAGSLAEYVAGVLVALHSSSQAQQSDA
jgi:hypothetical protein